MRRAFFHRGDARVEVVETFDGLMPRAWRRETRAGRRELRELGAA